jgi:WXG100 family type VII secretion target
VTMQYSFSDLENLSAGIMKAHGEVDRVKGDIRSSAGSLQADWSGSASESWATVQAKWDNACDGLVAALNHLASTVRSISAAMSQTERSNANLFNG